MSTPPFVRFYPNDWFTGCAGLKADERGVYVTMCVYIWTTGRRVPLDDAEAARMMSLNFKSYQRIRDRLVVLGKVTRHENGYGNDRAEHELAAATEAATGKGRPVATADRGDGVGAPQAATVGAQTAKNAKTDSAILTNGTIDRGIDGGIDHRIDGTIEGQKKQQNQAPFIEPESRTKDERETRARATVEVLAHGVEVNCETIRHSSFSISIPAIELGIAGRLPRDEVKRHCVAHALQWAAEIDGGKSSAAVVPGKIANFLVASIMGDLNRGASAARRAEVDKPRRSLTDAIRDREAKQRAGVTNG